MSGIRVVIDQQQLALPLPLADAHSLKVVEQRCQEQIQKNIKEKVYFKLL